MGYAELLEIVKGLFFKDGVSSKGKECNFEHDLCDFRQQPLPQSITVGHLYSETKMTTLKFYLRTKSKCYARDEGRKHQKRKVISLDSDSSSEVEEQLFDPFEILGNEVGIGQASSLELEGAEVLECLVNTVCVHVERSPVDLDQPDTPTVTFCPRSSPHDQNELDDTLPAPSTSRDQSSSQSTPHPQTCETSSSGGRHDSILFVSRDYECRTISEDGFDKWRCGSW